MSLKALSLIVLVVSTVVEGVDVGGFTNIFHNIRGNLVFNDADTFTINGFTYDGQGLRVFFYAYPLGVPITSDRGGTIIPVEGNIESSRTSGALADRPFNGETVVVNLPNGMDVCDIGILSVWCDPFDAVFGFIEIGRDVFEREGQDPCTLSGGNVPVVDTSFNNCIRLHETLQLSWRVDNDNSEVRFRLCGCQSDQDTNQYMGFGLSGSTTQTLMFGADPTITWVDTITGEANAVDYYLSAYTQCRAGVGACPDTLDSSGTCRDDVTEVSGFVRDGQQCVSFVRSFSTGDSTCDTTIDPTNQNQYIVWGVGGLGETAFRHFTRAQSTDDPIHLGRTPVDECMGVDLVCSSCPPFANERIVARENTTFVARIGPSGNERGYMAITGQAGWGITWYINDTLIPELIVERNKTYTFLVQGGDNANRLDVYHPFYISDSENGGRLQNSPAMQDQEVVYAGIIGDQPTAVGPLCEARETPQATTSRQTCRSFQEYQPQLEFGEPSQCNISTAGVLEWTPDEDTPDIVYYQCATHLNLGWRILVVNEGDPIPEPITRAPRTPPATTVDDEAKALTGSLGLSLLVAMLVMVVAVFHY